MVDKLQGMPYTFAMKTQTVIKVFGGERPLARKLGIRTQSIYDWKEIVPFGRQQQIEKLTDGKLKAMSWEQFLKARGATAAR